MSGARRLLNLWIAYDFVNSLLVINGSIYYSQWLVGREGVPEGYYGLAYAVSTAILILVAPALGALIDRRRVDIDVLYYCSGAMGVCGVLIWILGTSAVGWYRHLGTLILFGGIVFAYQLSLIAYNWILRGLRGLADVTAAKTVTGYGEAAGSLGSVVGALVGAMLFRALGQEAELRVILIMSVLFLVVALPMIWAMRRYATLVEASSLDTAGRTNGSGMSNIGQSLWREVLTLLRSNASFRRFVIVFMLYADALLTVQLYLPVLLREGIGLDPGMVPVAFAVALLFGAAGGMAYSRLVPRWRSVDVIIVSLVLWTLNLFWLATMPRGVAFWLCMMTSGILFGLLWSASRALMYELLDRKALGRGFGLYAVFERAASVLGPVIWAVAVGSGRYPLAIGAMALLVAGSAVLFTLWVRPPIARAASAP